MRLLWDLRRPVLFLVTWSVTLTLIGYVTGVVF